MAKLTLTDLVNLQNETTAVNAINANNAAIETAMENTLSRDGTVPNTMGNNLDMNSNQILNLPAPATADSPARLRDVVSGATIITVPPVGTSGAVVGLLNTNNTHSGNNTFTGTNSFTTISVSGHPTIEGVTSTGATGTGKYVFDNSPTLITPNLGTPSAINTTNATNVPVNQAIGNLSVNRLNSGTSAGATTFWRGDGTWTVPTLSFASAVAGADVLLNNTGTFFDGPAVAIGGLTGTWYVCGIVTCIDTAGAAIIHAKLYDGTTTFASTINTTLNLNSSTSITLACLVTNPSANFKIACKDITSTSGKILFNQTGLSRDTTIWAFRIA